MKQLVESIFDDDDDFHDQEVSVMSTLMDPYEVTKHFEGMSDTWNRNSLFRNILEKYTS
ncbi:MAG: hypothetical protein [Hatfieldvirus porci]|uniref:Uncharacterized protein n=1 Tax=phage Lak_Megaphage_RVC_JS4_GC31 TaxID=3109228 RepID=A0ABZ0Z3G0_9CAUD|nr:MAG: hypothetical protein [phage Lak_Megaphage_RVC_JS4_GC31]